MYTKITPTNLPALSPVSHARPRTRGVVLGWLIGLLSLVVLSLGLLPVPALAAQGYNTSDKTISKAMAVAIASSVTTGNQTVVTVEKSSVSRANKTLGVVVDPKADPVSVSSTGDQVYVATSGEVQVFVTDLNGSIKKGDLLAPSPIEGVLMKASDGAVGILGAAQQDMPTTQVESVQVKDATAGTISAKVSLIQMNMDVRFGSNSHDSGQSFLQQVGQTLARHPVSTTQAFVALVILVLLIIVEGGIVYAAVSSSIISLGRNPMAKKTILRGMGQVTGLVVVVLVTGLLAIYAVLWI